MQEVQGENCFYFYVEHKSCEGNTTIAMLLTWRFFTIQHAIVLQVLPNLTGGVGLQKISDTLKTLYSIVNQNLSTVPYTIKVYVCVFITLMRLRLAKSYHLTKKVDGYLD
jgi:hypothetical protein